MPRYEGADPLVRYDHRKFWRWLNAKAPGEEIGYSCDSSRCPLKQCFGQAPDERGYRVPRWAENYLWHIDTTHDHAKLTKEDGLAAWHKTFSPDRK